MKLLATLFLIVGLGSLLSFGQEKTPEQERADLFTGNKVIRVNLEIDPKSMDALRKEPRKYVPVTLKEGDKSFPGAGVHLKGAAGSFRGIDDKPGLTLNMDKFTGDKLFHGLDKFHLANAAQDPSYCAELIAGELFRAAGVPTSRIAHAVVSINGKPKGFYYVKEGYDKTFLKNHFGSSHGNFYDGGFLRDLDQPLTLVSGKDTVKPLDDIKALWAACEEKDLDARWKKFDKLLDLDKFIAYLAVETATWDWDGYPMNRNNYRIYHDPLKDKLVFIPSGMDQMWHNPGGPIFPDFQGRLARKVMEIPQGKAKYTEKLREVMAKMYNADAMTKRLDELVVKLQPEFATVDPGAAKDLPNRVKGLKDAIVQRAKSIEEQLKKLK